MVVILNRLRKQHLLNALKGAGLSGANVEEAIVTHQVRIFATGVAMNFEFRRRAL
jgi:hypothetical protein